MIEGEGGGGAYNTAGYFPIVVYKFLYNRRTSVSLVFVVFLALRSSQEEKDVSL